MGFSRQEYWSGLPRPPPGDLPDPGIEPGSLTSPALAGGSSPLAPPVRTHKADPSTEDPVKPSSKIIWDSRCRGRCSEGEIFVRSAFFLMLKLLYSAFYLFSSVGELYFSRNLAMLSIFINLLTWNCGADFLVPPSFLVRLGLLTVSMPKVLRLFWWLSTILLHPQSVYSVVSWWLFGLLSFWAIRSDAAVNVSVPVSVDMCFHFGGHTPRGVTSI